MNWFKKSIAYDQKRKLIGFFVFLVAAFVLFSTLLLNQLDLWKITNVGSLRIIEEEYMLYFYPAVALITLVSIGIFNRSEVGYIPSMPMKRSEIIYTKLSCAVFVVVAAVLVSLIIMTVTYLFNLGFLSERGLPYSAVLIPHIGYILSGLLTIGILYLMHLMFGDIKVPIVVFIIGAPSVLYMTFRILDIFNFNGGSFVGNILSYLLEGLREFIFLISGTLYNDMIFNTWYRGWLFIALGIIGLLYCLIIFIAEKYSNDIYARLFPFKVSKILVYTGIYFFVMVCVEWVSRLVIEVGMNIVGLYGTYFSIAYNAPVVVAVLAFPLLIKVTNKIVKKLNETF